MQDIENGKSVIYCDPHGQDAPELIDSIPRARTEKVCKKRNKWLTAKQQARNYSATRCAHSSPVSAFLVRRQRRHQAATVAPGDTRLSGG